MSVIKVIELLSSSDKSWEDAAEKAVVEASKTIKNIRSLNIQNQSVTVKDGKLKEYRINARIAFEVN